MVQQLQALGAPEDVIHAATAQQIENDCEVQPDCWQSVQAFLALSGQWRIVSTMAGVMYQGIHFPSIKPCFKGLGIKKRKRKEVFADLVLMSNVAANALNSKLNAN